MRLSSVFVLSCLLFSGVLASPKPMMRRHGELLRSAGHKTRRINRVVAPVAPPEPPASVVSSAPVRRRSTKRCVARNSTMTSSSSASNSSSTHSSAPAPVNVAPAPSIHSSTSEKEPATTTVKKPSASPKPPPPPTSTHSSSSTPPPPPPTSSSSPPPKSSSTPPPKPSPSPPPESSSSSSPKPSSSSSPPPPPPSSPGIIPSVASIVANGVNQAADLTFFTPGLGACGIDNSDSDLIVAVGEGLFDGFPGATEDPNHNPVCNRKIRITYQGQSLVVTATDRCTGCNDASLDLTPGAFQHFAAQSAGRLHDASWDWCTDC